MLSLMKPGQKPQPSSGSRAAAFAEDRLLFVKVPEMHAIFESPSSPDGQGLLAKRKPPPTSFNCEWGDATPPSGGGTPSPTSGSEPGSPCSVLPPAPAAARTAPPPPPPARAAEACAAAAAAAALMWSTPPPLQSRMAARRLARGSSSLGRLAGRLAVSLEAGRTSWSKKTVPNKSQLFLEWEAAGAGEEVTLDSCRELLAQMPASLGQGPCFSAKFEEAQKAKREGGTAPIVPFLDPFGHNNWAKEPSRLHLAAAAAKAPPAPSKDINRGPRSGPPVVVPRRSRSATGQQPAARRSPPISPASSSASRPLLRAKSAPRGWFSCFGSQVD